MSVMSTFRDQIKSTISNYGFHAWGIFGTPDNPSPTFTYTTGFYEKELPEFLMIGFDSRFANMIFGLLNHVRTERGHNFENGEVVFFDTDSGKKCVVVFDARDSVKDDYTIQTGQYYGTEDYRVQQVILPDDEGRLPNHQDCEYGKHQLMFLAEPIAATTVSGLRN